MGKACSVISLSNSDFNCRLIKKKRIMMKESMKD